MSDADPRLVWDALDRLGYGPRGRLHDFRSRCPAHDGDNPTSLHVSLAAGGGILLHCFAYGCPAEEIVERIGLRLRDLYPADPGDSGRRLRTARREDFTGNARSFANVLLAVGQLGIRWAGALWLDECPNCEWPWAQLTINSTGEPSVYCQRGCDLRMVNQALADRLIEHRRRAA